MNSLHQEISALVPMPRLLEALRIEANERTRRGPCPIHGGSNTSAFSWRDDGRWHCFSCGRGGDRIALVRAAKNYSFREAVELLARLAGVEFRAGHATRMSPRKRAKAERQRETREQAAWRISDEISRLRRYYTDALHRTERLQTRIGEQSLQAASEAEREAAWERLARLIPAGTFFFAAWNFIWDAKAEAMVRFALSTPAERRRFILEGDAREDSEAAA